MSGNELIKRDKILRRIYRIRDVQVMIDRDLASLHHVETRILNQAVKRNAKRFPKEFCFQLDGNEFAYWESQGVMSNGDKTEYKRLVMRAVQLFYRGWRGMALNLPVCFWRLINLSVIPSHQKQGERENI